MVDDRGCGVGGCGGGYVDIVDLQSGARTTTTIPVEWSPDGRWLLLRPLEGGVVGDSLLIVPADLAGTGGVLDISDSLPGARRLPLNAAEDEYHDVGWMPDSSALIDSVEQGDESAWNPRIDVIPIADGERRTVIDDGFGPVVSPDGSHVVFTRGRPNASQAVIWVAAADGSDQRRVTTSLTEPTWSPDGSRLLAMDEQGWFTVLPDGTGRTRLPSIARTEPRFLASPLAPSWQPLP
jgi:Tol biopolymer transport system component